MKLVSDQLNRAISKKYVHIHIQADCLMINLMITYTFYQMRCWSIINVSKSTDKYM